MRIRALTALRGVMKPTAATLDLLRLLMRITPSSSSSLSSSDHTALRKSASLMFGVLAENVNASDVAAARSMRRDLLERLMFAKSDDERHVLVRRHASRCLYIYIYSSSNARVFA